MIHAIIILSGVIAALLCMFIKQSIDFKKIDESNDKLYRWHDQDISRIQELEDQVLRLSEENRKLTKTQYADLLKTLKYMKEDNNNDAN